jgi:hypothetical protein
VKKGKKKGLGVVCPGNTFAMQTIFKKNKKILPTITKYQNK